MASRYASWDFPPVVISPTWANTGYFALCCWHFSLKEERRGLRTAGCIVLSGGVAIRSHKEPHRCGSSVVFTRHCLLPSKMVTID